MTTTTTTTNYYYSHYQATTAATTTATHTKEAREQAVKVQFPNAPRLKETVFRVAATHSRTAMPSENVASREHDSTERNT